MNAVNDRSRDIGPFVEGPDDKEILEFILNKYYDVELERVAVIDTK